MTGYKPGSGAPLSEHEISLVRRERLKKLALETTDLRKDPYLARTQMGTFECRLCGTLHSTEGSYLAHSQGRKHQVGLVQRLAQLKQAELQISDLPSRPVPRRFVKIGRPLSRLVSVVRDGRSGFAVSVFVPQISVAEPALRVMSAYEQRVQVLDPAWQFLLVAAEPYETVAFRVPNRPVELDFHNFHDKLFTAQFFFK